MFMALFRSFVRNLGLRVRTPQRKGPDCSGPSCMNPKLYRVSHALVDSACSFRGNLRWSDSNRQPPGYEPGELPIAPHRGNEYRPTRLWRQAAQVLLAFLAVSTLCFAQQGSLTLFQATAATSQIFNNTNPRYNAWTVMYSYSGSGTFSIELDCAPDATVAGGTPTPGSFTACTATTGSNPSTTHQYGYITFVGYQTSLGSAPWIRLNLTAISSGNMTAFAAGFNPADPESGTGGGGGCVGTATTPCIVAGPNTPGTASTKNPVQIAGNDGTDVRAITTDSSGRTVVVGGAAVGSPPAGAPVPEALLDHSGNIIIPNFCNTQSAINLSAVTGENQIIALSGSTVIRLCNIAVAMTAASTVSIDVGTGTNCGTGTTTIWGPYPSNTTGFTEDWTGILTVPAGDAVCLNFGGTVTAGGGVSYAQY
jgi:hypothetical protein